MENDRTSSIPMDGLYHYNDDMHRWERLDRVQEYKGHTIRTITHHRDSLLCRAENHREYHITFPSGRTAHFGINKRGGNIKSIKEWIDFNIKYDRKEHL